MFEREIGCTGATADDKVSTLGGDSLQAISIVADLEARFGIAIPIEVFEESRDIRELADWIGKKSVRPETG